MFWNKPKPKQVELELETLHRTKAILPDHVNIDLIECETSLTYVLSINGVDVLVRNVSMFYGFTTIFKRFVGDKLKGEITDMVKNLLDKAADTKRQKDYELNCMILTIVSSINSDK